MAVRLERGRWIALLLAGALVVHLFMLTGVPQQTGDGATHADHMAEPGPSPRSGEDASGSHGAGEMLLTCVAVLALLTAGVVHVRATRGKPRGEKLKGLAGLAGQRADHATCRDGPRPSRVAAGVLLRV